MQIVNGVVVFEIRNPESKTPEIIPDEPDPDNAGGGRENA
jgi:hypothetical protein